jgi:drug/metabolite transporter (DMT)-like permease
MCAIAHLLLCGFCVCCTRLLEKVQVTTLVFWCASATAMMAGVLGWSRMPDDTTTILKSGSLATFMLIVLSVQVIGTFSSKLAISQGSAATVSVIESAYPLWILVLSVVFGGNQSISMQHIGGALLVFAGIALIFTAETTAK